MNRYARQVAVPGVGRSGQDRIRAATVKVAGSDLDSETCALYLIGAGVGRVSVAPALIPALSGLNEDVIVEAEVGLDGASLLVEVAEHRFVPQPGAPVRSGSEAARWALARVLSPRGDETRRKIEP